MLWADNEQDFVGFHSVNEDKMVLTVDKDGNTTVANDLSVGGNLTGVKLVPTDCTWKCDTERTNSDCPDGQVMSGMCSSKDKRKCGEDNSKDYAQCKRCCNLTIQST